MQTKAHNHVSGITQCTIRPDKGKLGPQWTHFSLHSLLIGHETHKLPIDFWGSYEYCICYQS